MDINILIGKTVTNIEKKHNEIIFIVSENEKYKMYHEQDCCECVSIDDIEGDLGDLIGNPILQAEEVNNEEFEKAFLSSFNKENEYGSIVDDKGDCKPDSCTWTFYKLATIKGYVTIRWYGESNGYYSEDVDFIKMKDGKWLRSWEE